MNEATLHTETTFQKPWEADEKVTLAALPVLQLLSTEVPIDTHGQGASSMHGSLRCHDITWAIS